MIHSVQNKRKRKPKNPCKCCGINLNFCICLSFKKIQTSARVDLLIHYKELKRTSNSGHLIESLLNNQKVWVRGERYNELDHSKVIDSNYFQVLLYPSDNAIVASKENFLNISKGKPLQVLVPDGNWRQASKVHYRVKEFKDIPRVTLPDLIADRESLLREETKENGMSTLEAIAHLLYYTDGLKAKEHLLKAYKLKKDTQQKLRKGL